MPGLWLRLPNSVTSPLLSNLYIGLKSTNALNINFFLLPVKLLPLLNLLICTAWSLFSLSCYSPLICCHPLSTTYIFFSKNHQSLISLCITLSLLSASFRQPCTKHPADDVTLSNSHAHHSHPPSYNHCYIPGSKLTFSTNLFHRSLLAPTSTAFSDYTGPDLLCSTVFHFWLFFLFYFGFTASFQAHINMVSLLPYLLTYSIADVTAWTTRGRCRVSTTGHATVIRRLIELWHVGI